MYVLLFQVRPVFPKKKHRLESKLCTSNQTVQNFKECQRTVDKQVFLEILPIAPHILKSLIQFQGNQHHFHIHFHVILKAFIYVFTHKIRERHKEKYFVIPSLIMMEVSR